jgi:hypothetical protein
MSFIADLKIIRFEPFLLLSWYYSSLILGLLSSFLAPFLRFFEPILNHPACSPASPALSLTRRRFAPRSLANARTLAVLCPNLPRLPNLAKWLLLRPSDPTSPASASTRA